MKAKTSKKRTTAAKPRKKAVPKRSAKAGKAPKPARGAKAVKAKPSTKRAPKKAESKTAAPPAPAARAKGTPKIAPAATLEARRKAHAAHRALLQKRQSELMQAYSISKGDSQSHLDNGTEDYIDYAVNSYAREFLLSLSELDRKQLLMVEDALRRIDRGDFGQCQQCGEPIHPKRLEVSPWVKYCLRCQELEEKGLLPAHGAATEDEDGDEQEIDEEGGEGAAAEDDVDAGSDEEDFEEAEEVLVGEDDETDDADSDDAEE